MVDQYSQYQQQLDGYDQYILCLYFVNHGLVCNFHSFQSMLIEKMTNKECKGTLVLNVGGVRHKTQWSTIEKIPGTRLSMLAKLRENDESYDPIEDEYYFDRNPDAFLCILEYYRYHINLKSNLLFHMSLAIVYTRHGKLMS